MLTMTDYETPKFPAVPTPEEMKAASEKVMNFWVGALSPMWVPFWAASSFGLSAWALTQNMAKNEGLMKDLPLAPKWPGFASVWGANTPSEVLEEAKATARPVVEATEKAVKDTTKTVAKAAEKVVDDASGAVVQAVDATPEPKIAFDPVVEAPVAVEQAAVEGAAVLKDAAETVVKPAPKTVAAKVTPKPIAKAVSAVKPKKV